MARIGVLNAGFYSHAAATTRAAVALARQGHDVIAWGAEQFRGSIEASGAKLRGFDPGLEAVHPDTPWMLVNLLADATEGCSEELIDQLYREQLELVVHDGMMPWGRVAGQFLGLPRLVTQPMFPGTPPAPEVVDLPEARVERERRYEATRLRVARRWRVELGNWRSVMFSPGDATVTLTTERLADGYKLGPGWHYVGPLIDPIPRQNERTGPPLVYVCLGTAYNRRAEPFRAAIEALAEEPVDVLVSTGRGQLSSGALAPLPPNVTVRDFVDARDVLARADLHITHAGSNSVHESLVAGVPMVCLPQAVDQFPMANRIERLGAGRIVEESPLPIREAVRVMLGSDRVRTNVSKLAQHLARYDGAQRLTEIVQLLISDFAAAGR